jgi:hypothetical protein
MSKLYFGAAALAGAALMFAGWWADYQQRASVERIEQWQPPHSSDRAR